MLELGSKGRRVETHKNLFSISNSYCPDRRFNECVWDIGISNFVMYSGVILFKMPYI